MTAYSDGGASTPSSAPTTSWPPVNPTARAALKNPTERPRPDSPPRALTMVNITGMNPTAKTA